LTVFAVLAVACTEAGQVTAPVAESAVSESIRRLGFNPKSMVDAGDYYIVEGDIAIAKSALERQTDDTTARGGLKPRRQYFTDTLVSLSKVGHIKVDLSQISGDAAWLSAARTAMSNWNSIPGSVVTFVEESPADIVVKFSDRPCNVGGAAVFPTGNVVSGGQDFQHPGMAGPVIWINSDEQWCISGGSVTPSNSQRVFVVTHELGHTIGLRHTDWAARHEPEDTTYVDPDGNLRFGAGANAFATTTDGASIMNGSTLGNSWVGFSHFDSLAATIYNGMNVVDSNEGGHPKVAVTIPRGSLSFELRLVTHHREYNDNFVLVYSESSDLVTSGGGSVIAQEFEYVDQLSTWGYSGCSTYSDFPYPEEWKDWQIIVQYPQGPVYAGVAAHVMSSGGWQECH
jgi:hypothetical protein